MVRQSVCLVPFDCLFVPNRDGRVESSGAERSRELDETSFGLNISSRKEGSAFQMKGVESVHEQH